MQRSLQKVEISYYVKPAWRRPTAAAGEHSWRGRLPDWVPSTGWFFCTSIKHRPASWTTSQCTELLPSLLRYILMLQAGHQRGLELAELSGRPQTSQRWGMQRHSSPPIKGLAGRVRHVSAPHVRMQVPAWPGCRLQRLACPAQAPSRRRPRTWRPAACTTHPHPAG